MRTIRAAILLTVGLLACPAFADDITDALDAARKSYQSGDLTGAKQSADLASQLIGQKNAEGFVTLLPKPLSGWTAEEAQATAVGNTVFGASQARRTYKNAKGDNVEVQITGDSAIVAQMAPIFANPAIAGAMGKLIKVGSQRGIQTHQGDVQVVVNNNFLVMVTGSGQPADKLAYAQAIDFAKLSKM
jgi:hypothetical protein